MSMPFWAVEAAEQFWRQAGTPPAFPRDLRPAVAHALPLSVTYLPRLRTSDVDAYLRRRGVACALAAGSRPLHACLIAYRESGFVFVDGADLPDEQRFSLAHEVAHFMHDHLRPRRQAAARLGASALEVLDGRRAATAAERYGAILRDISLTPFVHLTERSINGDILAAAIEEAESAADLLAYELLAPADGVIECCTDAASAARELEEMYGLPAGPARRYAALLFPDAGDAALLRGLQRALRSGDADPACDG
jgi:hypothetical protein